MSTDQNHKSVTGKNASPMAIVGTILAQGVIRLIEGQDLLDKSTEERVSTGVLATMENTQ